jgi:histidinol-phosphate phosphatase family protein
MSPIPLSAINRSWTLFLDRDGVINRRLPAAYVRHPGEFVFLPGVPAALAQLGRTFGRVLVVTNQQGVGKGLMTGLDLAAVHAHMQAGIKAAGGRLDGIYACPDRRSQPGNCRKPGPALALRAQRDFPAIDFTRSLMVGDTPGDLEFGRRLGMYTVWVAGTEAPPLPVLYDLEVAGLPALVQALAQA